MSEMDGNLESNALGNMQPFDLSIKGPDKPVTLEQTIEALSHVDPNAIYPGEPTVQTSTTEQVQKLKPATWDAPGAKTEEHDTVEQFDDGSYRLNGEVVDLNNVAQMDKVNSIIQQVEDTKKIGQE